jgi:hypothetical protein
VRTILFIVVYTIYTILMLIAYLFLHYIHDLLTFAKSLVIMMDYYKSCKSNQALVRTGPRAIIIVNCLAQ